MTTTRLAAAVELSSGRGDAHGPLLAEPVAWALSDGGVVAAAGHRPDRAATPSGGPPPPPGRGGGARGPPRHPRLFFKK
jgi:hypothetical protein